jgi:hypothetical protein
MRSTRRYRDDTLVLETDFETADGAVTLIDFMPPRGEASDVVRIVVGRRGQLPMRCELVLRFDYGALVPTGPRAASSRRRPPRYRSSSGARATGTIATAGSGTQHSPCSA